MRRALIDYLLSDECKYTSYERLMLFVLHAAIEGSKENIDKKEIEKATGMHRATVYRNLASLKAKDAIAHDGTSFVVKEAFFAPSLPSSSSLPPNAVGGTIGGEDSNRINNDINRKDAGAGAGEDVQNATLPDVHIATNSQNATLPDVHIATNSQNATLPDVHIATNSQNATLPDVHIATNSQNATPPSDSEATPSVSAVNPVAQYNALKKQQAEQREGPRREMVSEDGYGGRTYVELSDDEKAFLKAYRKEPENFTYFSHLYRQTLKECDGPEQLIEAAEGYTKALLQKDHHTWYRKLPEKFLYTNMWRDYLPQATESAAAKETPVYSDDEQKFLQACEKEVHKAEKFHLWFRQAMDEVGSVDTLIAAVKHSTDNLRDRDGNTMRLPRPENWLADHGWRDYVKQFGVTPAGHSAGIAGGRLKSLFDDDDDDSSEGGGNVL